MKSVLSRLWHRSQAGVDRNVEPGEVKQGARSLAQLINSGQQHAWNGNYLESIKCFLDAARLDDSDAVIAASLRNVLSADGLKITEATARDLLSLFPDDEFIKSRVHAIAAQLDMSGPHSAEGRDDLAKRLAGLSELDLIRETGERFRAGDAFLGAYFEEAYKRRFGQDGSRKQLQCTEDHVVVLINAATELLYKVENDPELAASLSVLIGNDEHLSLLQAIISHFGKAGSSTEAKIPDLGWHLLAKAISMQGRSALRYLGKVEAGKHVLAEHAAENPDDWSAQLDHGRACLRQPSGVHDATTLMAGFLGTEFDVETGIRQINRAIELRPDDNALRAALVKARRDAIPPFVFVGFPRSGSVFVYTSLVRGLRIPGFGGIHGGAFPDFTLAQEGLNVLLAGRGTAHTHLRGSKTNLLELYDRYNLQKMLVHVRDPRQALLSWHDFMPKIAGEMDPVQSKHYDLPADYLQKTSEAQLDWLIDNWLSVLVTWLDEWKCAAESEEFGTEIYFSKFEDMRADQHLFFKGILDFFEIDEDLFDPPSAPSGQGDRNFRKGELESWKSVLSPDQYERVRQIVSDDLLSYFGWPAHVGPDGNR